MSTREVTRRARLAIVWGTALVLLSSTALAKGGGNVLPPNAKPHGLSLTDMAELTALFNTGPRDRGTEPNTPFQILYYPSDGDLTFTVRPGTYFYVPIFWSDNSEPVLGEFPDVTDPEAVADYYFSPEQLGARALEISVDGKVTSLIEEGYPVGAFSPTSVGGTEYTTVGAFLAPLSRGTHEVTFRIYFDGAAFEPYEGVVLFEATYTVIVQ